MSNTTTVDPFLTNLALIQNYISVYGYSTIFILGNIGSILNILILTQRNYLRNSCSCYILASTITNLFIINIVVLFRLLTGFNIDPTKTSTFFCKFRAYIVQMITLLSRAYIVLACIDRWAMTSTVVRQRAMSNMKIPKVVIPSIAIVCALSFIHVLFYQDIVRDRCVISSDTYTKFYNIYNTILSGIFIPMLMMIFSMLTVRNVKRLQGRIALNTAPINQILGNNIMNKRKHDYQLFFMIFVQQCVYIITTLPFVSYLLYATITMYSVKSTTQIASDNLYMTFVYTFLHVNFSATFYIYTLTSHIFRKDFKKLLTHNRFVNFFLNNRENGVTTAALPDEINVRKRATATVHN
ncbi:hypothetical protein I4U23_025424 [Adineta vaga]|nr:hypothetical protein I4U23_025424 [Adineta vaga]